jgi:hypothetical protein
MSTTPVSVKLSLSLGAGDVPARPHEVHQLVIAGWTGRDRDALEQHIGELEALGVKRPGTTPIFYRVSVNRATFSSHIEVTGAESSGEVEFVLLATGGKLWVGVGSDHTDRAAECYDVTASKQMYEKPIAPLFWDYTDVAAHWDNLLLRSYIEENGERVLYQQGSVLEMLDPLTLITRYTGQPRLPEGCMMFCGTLPTREGVRYSDRFEVEIEDPVLGRRISHSYTVECLPFSE